MKNINLNELKERVFDKYYDLRDVEKYNQNFQLLLKKIEEFDKKEFSAILNKIKSVYTEDSIYKYFQLATELTIGNYLRTEFPDSYISEYKAHGPKGKDIDFQIEFQNIKYNIEVKCPHLKNKDNFNKVDNKLKINFMSRGESIYDYHMYKEEIEKNILNDLMKNSNYEGYEFSKLEDDKIKDFLIDANKKFSNEWRINQVNILMIGLDTPHDFSEWYFYLTNNRTGFLSEKSYINHNEYDNVDIIILSNIVSGHRNNSCLNEFDSWDLRNYCNVFVVNPFSKSNKELTRDDLMRILSRNLKVNKKSDDKVLSILKNGILDFGNRINTPIDEVLIRDYIDVIIEKFYNDPELCVQLLESLHMQRINGKFDYTDHHKCFDNLDSVIPNSTIHFNNYIKNRIAKNPEYENIAIVDYIYEHFPDCVMKESY